MAPLAFGEGETKGRIKNIINFKQPKFYIIAIALTILIVSFVGLTTNPKKDSKYYAEEFLQIFTNPEDAEFKKYYDPIFDSESATESQNNFENYIASIEKEYRDLMTNEAFDHAMSNRFIPFEALIKEDNHYNIEVDSIDVKEAKVYDDGRVHYIYLLSLRVLFSNVDAEAVSVSGDIIMIEENGSWLVDVFRWNSDYRDLYKLLLTNLEIGEVKEDTSTFTKQEIDSADINKRKCKR